MLLSYVRWVGIYPVRPIAVRAMLVLAGVRFGTTMTLNAPTRRAHCMAIPGPAAVITVTEKVTHAPSYVEPLGIYPCMEAFLSEAWLVYQARASSEIPSGPYSM